MLLVKRLNSLNLLRSSFPSSSSSVSLLQASDSGKPRLSSSCWVFVRVVGDSQYRPSVNPLDIYIVTATDSYPGGPIGRIYASDRDVTDVLSFTQRPLQQRNPFKINRQDGSVVAVAGLEPGRYTPVEVA